MKKKPNPDKRAKVYKGLAVTSTVMPLVVIGILTVEISQTTDPGTSVNFGIAGLTIIFIQTMTALGKLKSVLGNRVFVLALFTIITYLIRHVADQMFIALVASLVGTIAGNMFENLSQKNKAKGQKALDNRNIGEAMAESLKSFLGNV